MALNFKGETTTAVLNNTENVYKKDDLFRLYDAGILKLGNVVCEHGDFVSWNGTAWQLEKNAGYAVETGGAGESLEERVGAIEETIPDDASEENKLATDSDVAGVQEDVDAIEGKIPSDTSTNNKLVNESGLQDAINNASESWSTGFTPKGESSVNDLNGLATQSNGDSYIVTDSGTLTDGSLSVMDGDQVAWDAANSVWYKLPQYALKQFGTNEINNLTTSITSFRTGDVIAVDGPSGAAKMSKDKLLELTAQNALAGNAAPAFDPTRTSENPYKAGESVAYNGKIYTFKVDHYGVWAAADVYEISVAEMLVKYSAGKTKQANDGETLQIIQSDGSLTTSGSWRAYKFLVSSGTVFYRSYAANVTASNTLAVAFYNSETPSSASLISGVKFNATNIWQKGLVVVPSGTKCVLICSRTADGRTNNEADVGENLPELFSKIENKIAGMKTALTIADATIDSFYFNGTAFVDSPAWKRFTFDCYGNYFKVKAVAATNNSGFGEVIFLDENKGVISYESFGGHTGVAITKELSVPSGCRYICVCNRTENLANPEFYAYSETMRDASIPVINAINAKIGRIESEVLDLENKFVSLDLENAIMQIPYYYNGTTLTFSNSWATYVFKNEGFSKIKVKAATNTAGFSEIVFCSNENLDVLSNVTFGTTGTVTKDAQVPAGCKYICICNRTKSLETPEFSAYSENLQNVFETIKGAGENFAGVIKFKPVASRVIYNIRIGEVSEVAKHFKMALVKDGLVKYFVNATNILKDENGLFDSVLDGTDGDLLIVNDVPVYFITGYVGDAAVRLFSLVPFEYGGVQARKVEPRGEAPSLCFVDNINDSSMSEHETNLGTGKSHYTRNSSNVAYYSPMSGMVGKYVPSESGGVISYAYDSSKSFIESGACRPTVWLNQNTAERAASNKDTEDVAYTNMDLLSLEIVLALAEAECGTNFINDPELFGDGFASPTTTGATINESVFTDGTTARNGVRFKDSSDAWVYQRLNLKPFNNDKFLFEMLTDWMSPWEIMEQHLVLSYAKTNSISANTWFVYNGNEYKYINVGTLKGLSDGIMTAVLFKKFRSKIASGITYNGASVAGNDIEFVIISSVYRGWILDVSPHRWVTGLNVTVDDANNYKFFGTLNYKKYITNQDYTEIDEDELFDFEKQYNLVSEITDAANAALHSKYTKEGSAYIPTECGTALAYYECSTIETDKKKADTGKKIVTGVKLGYGAFSDGSSRNFLYLWHPRTYYVAKAGYSSFVCQNVKV